MNIEMNDRGDPSWSGDIVLLMDTSQGVISVNEGDILPGWHGGPTAAETQVPMVWSYAGSDGADAAHRSDLIEAVIRQHIENLKQQNQDNLRTIDFRQILKEIREQVDANHF